jgi:hypothetical protein
MTDVYCFAFVEDTPSAAAAENSPSLDRALKALMKI